MHMYLHDDIRKARFWYQDKKHGELFRDFRDAALLISCSEGCFLFLTFGKGA